MQAGTLTKIHGGWHLRYYVMEIGSDGQPCRRQVKKLLARVSDDYRSPKDLQPLVAAELAKVNHGGAAHGNLTLAQFADQFWLPTVAVRRRASTHKFYKDLFNNHLRNSEVGGIKLRDLQTVHVQKVLDSIRLSQTSLRGIKTGMSALYNHALRLGFVSGANPVYAARPEGRRSNFEGAAYTAADVEYMLSKLVGIARVVVATAA